MVSRAMVPEELKLLARSVALDLVRDMSDEELQQMRDSELAERLETEIEKREKKRKKAKIGEEFGKGAAPGWGGGMALGVPGVGLVGQGMPSMGVGVSVGGMLGAGGAGWYGLGGPGGFGGSQFKKAGAAPAACLLCNSTIHKVAECQMNVLGWDYRMIQRLLKEGKSSQQIVALMASAQAANQQQAMVPYQPQGGAGR